MKLIERFDEHPFLKRLFLSYLLLGSLDTVHHLHAALALGQSNAIHAVWVGLALIPVATTLTIRYLYSNNIYLLWAFFVITALAIVGPGFYHGGWDHVMKLLAFIRIDGESTNFHSLFPSHNLNLWFYEISGSLEFLFAVSTAILLYKTAYGNTAKRY